MENSPTISRDIKALKKRVRRLQKISFKRLDNAVCDIIDIGGYSLAVLLKSMSKFPVDRQVRVARKIEDFLYFHPDQGRKLVSRMKKTFVEVDEAVKSHILAAMVDVAERTSEGKRELGLFGEEALVVLQSDADLSRRSKAIEILAEAEKKDGIPVIINVMRDSLTKIDSFENYQFIETALLGLKRLGGESILKLLINPMSVDAIKQLRLEWKGLSADEFNPIYKAVQSLDENFAQLMLKVIDLSEFNLPFISMIQEGMSHDDKWVRQTAAEAMQKLGEAINPEILSRMLNDSASEVRLMAVSSLGGFEGARTGEMLAKLAGRDGESLEIRLNALYSLHSQKNLEALKAISKCENMRVAVNARGLAALLMSHEEGLDDLLRFYGHLKDEYAADVLHYLLELAEPADLKVLLKHHHKSENETHRERFLTLLKNFLVKKDGVGLKKEIDSLDAGEKKAVLLLMENNKSHSQN